MTVSEVQWLGLMEAFNSAAFDMSGWYTALEKLAAATGSRCGELVGLSGDPELNFHFISNFDFEAAYGPYVAAGGDDPEFNPRVKAGLAAPELKSLAESDFLPPDEHARNPHYQEFCRPWDIPYSCLTTLERRDGNLFGLSVLRSERDGPVTDRQRRTFEAFAPLARAAVRAQIAMEGRGNELLANSMDALSIPALICDRRGRVKALTAEAEAFVRQKTPLNVKADRLQPAGCADLTALNDAIDAATDPVRRRRPVLQTVVIRGGEGNSDPLVLDVVAVPKGEYELSFAPRVLIVIRGPRNSDGRKAVCRAMYGLTAAETEIAQQLADGNPPEAIANMRCVSVGTVRVQIKAILSKLGLSRQIELVARMNRL